MSLTQEQITKISENLTKIRTEDPKLAEDINNILHYIEMLDEVDTTGVASTVSVVEQAHELRVDEVKEKLTTTKDLLNCSNQKVVANQIAVSNIMK
jgi:aspartyl-tRNA(Asn)/glutamyl-tRNA(Gln) amidotransferase subunit C